MNKFILHIFLIIFFATLLVFPSLTLSGATSGLLLWYNMILPTLLPFIITTNLICKTNTFSLVTHVLGDPFKTIFQTSDSGTFAVIIGFLCGYPMGAKVIADLYQEHRIEKNEAQYLLSFCNNASPMFIISVLITQILCDSSLLLVTMLSLYGAPMIVSLFTRKLYKIKNRSGKRDPQLPTQFNMNIVDSSIMDGITLIVKIGAYVMLFSILIAFLTPMSKILLPQLQSVLPLLEITNGIKIYENTLPFIDKYCHLIFLTAFGGVCAIAQTQCVLQDTNLKISSYIVQKIITAMVAVILSYVLVSL